jgi:uncharacterized protein
MTDMTLAEAAVQLGVAPSTLRAQVGKGRLQARLAGKTYLVTPEEVARYRSRSRGRRGRPRRQGQGPIGSNRILVDGDALLRVAERWGIRSIAAFGSVARGDARPDSDIDLVMELAQDSPVGLFQHAQMAEELGALFGRRVDLVTWNALRPRLREAVRRDAVDLLARR